MDAAIAWGDVSSIADRVREHLDAGADHVCVQMISGRDDDVCLPALRELASRAAGPLAVMRNLLTGRPGVVWYVVADATALVVFVLIGLGGHRVSTAEGSSGPRSHCWGRGSSSRGCPTPTGDRGGGPSSGPGSSLFRWGC